jgi:ADP-ribose pyrophosphatase YjhB (NUDIX family)
MSNDIVFEHNGNKFNFRAVGILLHADQILLHKINANPYWSLPGGRVEFQESASTSVIREMKEELQVDCTVIRPLWVMENFFNSFGHKFHEIAFYFLLSVPGNLLAKGNAFTEMDGKSTLLFQWHPVNGLDSVELYPKFLRTSIHTLPSTLTYITHRD